MSTMFIHLTLAVLFVSGVHGGCSSGWVQHGESCYHLSHDQETWFDAETVCMVFGGYLAEIDGAAENNFIKSILATANTVDDAWVGASDLIIEGEWLWTHSRQQLSYTSWSPNEPNNSGNNENCCLVLPAGVWNDGQCRSINHYVCEAPISGDGSIVG